MIRLDLLSKTWHPCGAGPDETVKCLAYFMFQDVSRCTIRRVREISTRTDRSGPFFSVGPYRSGLPPDERIVRMRTYDTPGDQRGSTELKNSSVAISPRRKQEAAVTTTQTDE